MLRLQKLQLHSQQPIFSTRNCKHIRISVQNYEKVTQKAAKIRNQKNIYWQQSLPFPLIYNKQYSFQIFDKYEKGVNPEDSQNIMRGKIIFNELKQSHSIWDVFSSVNNLKIGHLSANIITKASSVARNLMKSSQKLSTQSPIIQRQRKVLRILSLVAKLPNIYLKKAHICIQIGSNIIKSPELKSKSNQLVFIQPRQVQLEQIDKEVQIKIYSIKPQQLEYPVAQTRFSLADPKLTKKLTLMKDGFQVGQLYVQSRVVNKSQISTTNYVQNLNKSIINNYRTLMVNQLQQNQMRSKNRYSTMSKSIDYSNLSSRLQDFGMKSSRISRPSGLDTSLASNTSLQRRNNSVVNQNSSIVFPKQRRFQIYQDRQNQNITYLNQRNFQFKFTNLGSKYKGAALGYGDKTDFVKKDKSIPGVGYYKLPSIWDRY